MPKAFLASAAACSHGAKYGCGPPGMSAILLSEAAAMPAPNVTATPQTSERRATERTNASLASMISSQNTMAAERRIGRADAMTSVYRVQYASSRLAGAVAAEHRTLDHADRGIEGDRQRDDDDARRP